MKNSLIQKLMARIEWLWRYLTPRRWYSAQMKMAEIQNPALCGQDVSSGS
jgi:hypothetical protein